MRLLISDFQISVWSDPSISVAESLYKWTKISSLDIDIFDLKMMVIFFYIEIQ